jgi:hypothetical protein
MQCTRLLLKTSNGKVARLACAIFTITSKTVVNGYAQVWDTKLVAEYDPRCISWNELLLLEGIANVNKGTLLSLCWALDEG